MNATEPIVIIRGQGGDVRAEGPIDQLAATLLQRAGFVPVSTPRQHWYRLPFDMGEDWENQHATYAADMLRAARYPIALDPSLLPPPHTHHTAGADTASLADQLTAAEQQPAGLGRLDRTLALLEALDPGGEELLGRVADLLYVTGIHLQEQRAEPEIRLGYQLRQISSELRVAGLAAVHLAMNTRIRREALRNAPPPGPAPSPAPRQSGKGR